MNIGKKILLRESKLINRPYTLIKREIEKEVKKKKIYQK